MSGHEGDELGQVAVVRTDGVRRGVLVQAQMLEELSELVPHRLVNCVIGDSVN